MWNYKPAYLNKYIQSKRTHSWRNPHNQYVDETKSWRAQNLTLTDHKIKPLILNNLLNVIQLFNQQVHKLGAFFFFFVFKFWIDPAAVHRTYSCQRKQRHPLYGAKLSELLKKILLYSSPSLLPLHCAMTNVTETQNKCSLKAVVLHTVNMVIIMNYSCSEHSNIWRTVKLSQICSHTVVHNLIFYILESLKLNSHHLDRQ